MGTAMKSIIARPG